MTRTVPYGCATVPPGGGVPTIALEDGVPLRLGGAGYAFAEPPNLGQLRDARARLAFLGEHLKSLCELWARPQRHFVDVYLDWIGTVMAAHAPTLGARVARFGGLYAAADFAFAALRPLPRAQLATGDSAAPWVRTDFLFWTGGDLIAFEIADGRLTRRPA